MSTTLNTGDTIKVKTYVFKAELEQDKDGRWSATIPVLPGCATWGHTKEEAYRTLEDAAQAYIETLIEDNKLLPQIPQNQSIAVFDSPAIAVHV
ncbi:MAG: type II toxin-antitoxin system HicB family antitoxin [Patescibacteria group bacterium]